MKPAAITDEQLKLRAFPFSLKDSARDWLYYLPENSIDTWLKIKQAFLAKYFPASRASQLKKEISNVEQRDGETMYEYWERFKRLYATCPYHGYEDQDLILYFCGGLTQEDARIVHAASGGGILNKNLTEAKALIIELAESSQIFDRKSSRRGVNAMGPNYLQEEKMDSLTSSVRNLVIGKHPARGCEICSSEGHVSQQCPQMHEEHSEEVNAAGYMEPPQRKWDSYSNTFNPGWKEHPNLKWGNQQGNQQFNQQIHYRPPRQYFQNLPVQSLVPTQPNPNRNLVSTQPNAGSQMSTEDMIRALVNNQTRFQQETQNIIKNLENQVDQLATSISRLEAKDSGVLTSTTMTNPEANVSAVSLRNGRQLVELEKKKNSSTEVVNNKEEKVSVEKVDDKVEESPFSEYEPEVPFREALKSTRNIDEDSDIYETFRPYEANISLLTLLKCVPAMLNF
ncbi:hypothetical protein RND81_09G186900 [Saponaria officinalis]